MLQPGQRWAAEKPPRELFRNAVQQSTSVSGARYPRILIVEDEFIVAWHLQALLRDMNFTNCEIAGDARGAIDRALDLEANLLLMDINLGKGPDGLEVVQRIWEHCDTAVIFITAYMNPATLNRIKQIAPEAPILSKPTTPEALHAAILKLFPTPDQ